MHKIPTLFERSGTGRGAHLLRAAKPECQWVLDGEGYPTRKYDGTCVMFDGIDWWARREIKPGKEAPVGFQPVAFDPVTEKTVGWEPVRNWGFVRWLLEAIQNGGVADGGREPWEHGTYELIGPKINGNPEGLDEHRLIYHWDAERLPDVHPREFETLKAYVLQLKAQGREGVVWHHPDGRMAKLKGRDFR